MPTIAPQFGPFSVLGKNWLQRVLRANPVSHQVPSLGPMLMCFLFQAILEFMYNGEVNVAQEDLNSFLAVAEDLKVKGLTQNANAGDPVKTNHVQPNIPIPAPPAPAPPISRPPTGPVAVSPTVPPPVSKNGSPSGSSLPVAKRFKRDIPGVGKIKEELRTNQQVVVTPDVTFETGNNAGGGSGVDAGDADDDERIDEEGGGFDDEGEGYQYGGYEGDDSMVDPSSMSVAGGSGADGSKGKFSTSSSFACFTLSASLSSRVDNFPL